MRVSTRYIKSGLFFFSFFFSLFFFFFSFFFSLFCGVLRELINSLVCCCCTSALGLVLFGPRSDQALQEWDIDDYRS